MNPNGTGHIDPRPALRPRPVLGHIERIKMEGAEGPKENKKEKKEEEGGKRGGEDIALNCPCGVSYLPQQDGLNGWHMSVKTYNRKMSFK